nr:uncharacterized protein LOC105330395 [Crassostrea gigas]
MNTHVLAALAVVLVSGMISLCEGNAAWNSYYYGNMRSPSRRSISKPTTRSPVYRRYPNPYRSTTRRYYPKPSPRRQRNYYMERKPTTATPVTEPPTPTTTTSGPLTAKPFTPQPYLYQMMTFRPSPIKRTYKSRYNTWHRTNFN